MAAGIRLYRRMVQHLPVFYFCWTAVFGATVAWILPPWQSPDEPAHLMRIVQISRGGLFGVRVAGSGGGVTDPSIVTALGPLNNLPFHTNVKLTGGAMLAAGRVRWSGPVAWNFANTAAYPPVLYAAAVPAALIGRLSRMPVIDTLRLVRVFDAVGAALLGAVAIAVARRTRLALAAVLVMPMSLGLAASASQDALLIPVTCLAVALIDRSRSAPLRRQPWPAIGALAFCLEAIVTARPPYLAMLLLPLLLPAMVRARLWIVCGLAAVALAWLLYVHRLGYPTLDADPPMQALRVFHHPLVFVNAVSNSMAAWWHGYIAGMVGTFGWLETDLPPEFSDFARWLIPLCMASAAIPDGDPRRWPRWVAMLAAFVGAAAVFLSMYLIWSPFRSSIVLGIQGRYFLPLLPALALGMPSLGRWATAFRPAALLGILALAASGPAVTLTTLVQRYYLQP